MNVARVSTIVTSTGELKQERVALVQPSYAKTHALVSPHVEKAIQVLLDVMNQAYDVTIRPADKIAAAKLILEYGLVKPPTNVQGSGEDGEFVHKVQVEFV
jgi:hypothetical protein